MLVTMSVRSLIVALSVSIVFERHVHFLGFIYPIGYHLPDTRGMLVTVQIIFANNVLLSKQWVLQYCYYS